MNGYGPVTLRSLAFAAVALLTLLASAGAAQEPIPVTPGSDPAAQSKLKTAHLDAAEPVAAEPDFRVVNLPSTLRLPRNGSSFQMTHRFNGNLRQGSFS